jgi:hypothetical protein
VPVPGLVLTNDRPIRISEGDLFLIFLALLGVL